MLNDILVLVDGFSKIIIKVLPFIGSSSSIEDLFNPDLLFFLILASSKIFLKSFEVKSDMFKNFSFIGFTDFSIISSALLISFFLTFKGGSRS